MRIISVKVDDLLFRRPGINKIFFTATYDKPVRRRGVVHYDTVNKKFLTHNSNVELLSLICIALRQPIKAYR